MKPTRLEEAMQVSIRSHFGEFIAKKCADKITLITEEKDTIIVDYFDTDLPPDSLTAQIGSTFQAIQKAKFPGTVDIIFEESDISQPRLLFQGREVLEMLYQFGVRFKGDEAYRSETTIGQETLKRL